ncbi:glycosyltransferase family 4 protein [Methylobacterium sp. P5_C11]
MLLTEPIVTAVQGTSVPLRPTVYFVANHSEAGGVGELWSDLSVGLTAKGFQARLIALWPGSDTSEEAGGRAAWRYVASEKPRSIVCLLRLIKQLVQIFRTEAPDCVVSAMPAANLLVPMAALLSNRSIRAITSHHTPADTLDWPMNWLDRYVGAPPNVFASVCVSKTVATSYCRRGGWLQTKQRVIANALPPAIEKHLSELSRIRQQRLGNEAPFHVVSLGRISAQKNYDVLIKAAPDMPGVIVSIIGRGPEEERLRDLADRLGVKDRVMFRGFMTRREALRALASADVFVQMSRFEGHSLALIEAAKLGLPLVVSNIPVQLEGITDESGRRCGIPVDLDDARGLAECITHLSSNRAFYEEMALRSRNVAAGISFDKTLARYESLLS